MYFFSLSTCIYLSIFFKGSTCLTPFLRILLKCDQTLHDMEILFVTDNVSKYFLPLKPAQKRIQAVSRVYKEVLSMKLLSVHSLTSAFCGSSPKVQQYSVRALPLLLWENTYCYLRFVLRSSWRPEGKVRGIQVS